jgi:hypothetical protein
MKLRIGFGFFLAALASHAVAQTSQPASPQSAIGYPSVDAALKDISSQNRETSSIHNGWTIFEDHRRNAVWWFTMPGHAAHPAAIRRQVVPKSDGSLVVQMSTLCEAAKASCDKVLAEFQTNEQVWRNMPPR